MINIENVVLSSPEQLERIIMGMRNPLNSWDKSDSCINFKNITVADCLFDNSITNKNFEVGDNDLSLMRKLANAGTDHRKFMRMMVVYADITANHFWWSEFDTYKVGTVRNSCSKMHKIHAKEFIADDFSTEGISEVGGFIRQHFAEWVHDLEWLRTKFNETKEKKYWRALLEGLPMGYNLKATVMLNYEVLANIYHSRKGHKLDEWREFCEWIESLPHSELIIGEVEK